MLAPGAACQGRTLVLIHTTAADCLPPNLTRPSACPAPCAPNSTPPPAATTRPTALALQMLTRRLRRRRAPAAALPAATSARGWGWRACCGGCACGRVSVATEASSCWRPRRSLAGARPWPGVCASWRQLAPALKARAGLQEARWLGTPRAEPEAAGRRAAYTHASGVCRGLACCLDALGAGAAGAVGVLCRPGCAT